MAITKKKKAEQLQKLEAQLKAATGVAFVQYSGPTVEEIQKVRQELKDKDMTYFVLKKTLMGIATKNAGLGEINMDQLKGPVAVITSINDEIAPAAEIRKLKLAFTDKETKVSKFDFAGAFFEGKFLSYEATAKLANTPSREESLTKIVGMLRSGPQKIHGVMKSGLQTMHAIMKNAEKFAA